MYKRVLSMFLCLAMVLSFAVPVVNAQEVSATDGAELSTDSNANVYLDGAIIADGNSQVIIDNNTVSSDKVEDDGNSVGKGLTDACDCGNADADLISHSDNCGRKYYYIAFCEKTAQELYDAWEKLPLDVQAFIETYLNSTDADKWIELECIIAKNAPPTGYDETVHNGAFVLADGIPEGGELSVQNGQIADSTVNAMVSELEAEGVTELFTWDISVQDAAGAQWQPNGKVKLTLELPDVELHKHEKIYILHKNKGGDVDYFQAQVTEDGKITFETNGFSTFAGFTVDFSYEGVEFSINGLTEILLSDLFDALEMPLDASKAVNVTFSDETLLKVEQVEGDWNLVSLKAFQTTEKLTVFMEDGKVYEITVTDDMVVSSSQDRLFHLYNGYYYDYWGNYSVNHLYNQSLGSYANYTYIGNGAGYTTTHQFKFDGSGSNVIITILPKNNAANGTGDDQFKSTYVIDFVSQFYITNGCNVTIRVSDDCPASVKEIIIRRPSNSTSGLFYIDDGSLTLKGNANTRLVVDNNVGASTAANYSSIYMINDASGLSLDYVTFRSSNTGAITLAANKMSSVEITNCNFHGLASGYSTTQLVNLWYGGGAITIADVYHSSYVSRTNYFNEVKNDSGKVTGYTYNTGYSSFGNGYVDVEYLLIDNCEFRSVQALTRLERGNQQIGAYGGSIALFGKVYDGDITNCKFYDGVAQGGGGAIAINGTAGIIDIDGCEFYGCASNDDGGVIATRTRRIKLRNETTDTVGTYTRINELNIKNCIFGESTTGVKTGDANCYSGNYGGCIGILSQINRLVITNPIISGAHAASGGAISVGTFNLPDYGKTVSFTNGKTQTIYFTSPDDLTGTVNATTQKAASGVPYTTVQYLEITGNIAETFDSKNPGSAPTQWNITDCYSMHQAAFLILRHDATVFKSLIKGVSVKDSYTRTEGSAVYLGRCIAKDFEIKNCWIQNCDFEKVDGKYHGNYTPATSTAAEVKGNATGGTIRTVGDTTTKLTVDNCYLYNNKSLYNGGAIYFNANNDKRVDSNNVEFVDRCVCYVKNSNIDSNTALRDGGGIYIEGNVEITNCKITNNTARNGGGVAQQVYNNADRPIAEGESSILKLDADTVISGNKAVVYTQSMYAYPNVYEPDLLNTGGEGGGISIRANATTALQAGKEFNYPISFQLNGATVSGNKAESDGGGVWFYAPVYTSHSSNAYDEEGNLKYDNITQCKMFVKSIMLDSGSIYGNIAGYGGNSGNGGGVYMDCQMNDTSAGGSTTLAISGASIYSNTANVGNGGGIYLVGDGAMCTITGGTIGGDTTKTNSATAATDGTEGNGGGIAIYGGAIIQMTGGTISYNSASTTGGGISVRDGSVMTSTAGSDGKGGVVSYNSAYAGGGIVIAGDSAMSMSNGTVSYNTSSYGGGILVMGSTGRSYSVNTKVTNGDGTVTNQTKTYTIDYGMALEGGSVQNNKAVYQTTAEDLTNQTFGGGICLSAQSTMLINDGEIKDNKVYERLVSIDDEGNVTVLTEETYTLGESGGGIAVCQGSDLTLKGGRIQNNHAFNGGGIAITGKSSVTMQYKDGSTTESGLIESNTADHNGGAIWMNDANSVDTRNELYISGGTIQTNSAVNIGGGVYLGIRSYASFTHGLIYNNSARCGGGIGSCDSFNRFGTGYVAMYTDTVINGVTIDSNTATEAGGGFYGFYYASIVVNDGTISNNKGGKQGGAITNYWYGATNISNGQITGNSAENGGGLYLYADSGTMTGGTISGNTATINGGGVWSTHASTTFTVKGGKIENNTANQNGGGVYADNNSTIKIIDAGKNDAQGNLITGSVNNNTAMNGGGVFVTGGADLSVVNGHIIENTAKGTPANLTTALMQGNNFGYLKGVGGGICVVNGASADNMSTFTLTGNSIAIYSNTADFAADDVYANGSNTDLNLPTVGAMDLSDYPFNALGWVEDYAYMDSAYLSGLAQANSSQNISNGQNVYRYRFSDVMYRVMLDETGIDTEAELAAFAPNVAEEYVCLTLGTPSALPDTVVIDFGLPVIIDLMNNDFGLANGSVGYIGVFRPIRSDGTVDFTEGLDANWDTSKTGCQFGSAVLNADGTVKYTLTSMTMDKQDAFSYAVRYTHDGVAYYFYSAVTVIPATTIYYEDNFSNGSTPLINFEICDIVKQEDGSYKDVPNTGKYWSYGSGVNQVGTQAQDRPGNLTDNDSNNIYGSDALYKNEWNTDFHQYSLDDARVVTVYKSQSNVSARATFTFKGTGFDLISLTDNTTGGAIVTVTNSANQPQYYFVDAYYGYTMNEEGEWVAGAGTGTYLYQVPVLKVDCGAYDTYTVRVYVAYNEMFDHDKNGSYRFFIDSVRIYNPANDGVWEYEEDGEIKQDTTVQDAYILDGEYAPFYQELRDLLINPGNHSEFQSGTTVNGSLFIDSNASVDGKDNAILEQYVHYGPNNEVYLASKQGITFDLDYDDTQIQAVHLGMKRLLESGTVIIHLLNSAGDVVKTDSITLDSKTEQFYDLSAYRGHTVLIQNSSVNTNTVVSLTSFKVTHKPVQNGSDTQKYNLFMSTNRDSAANAVNYLNSQNVSVPNMELDHPTVSFEDEIFYNIYFNVDDMSSVTEMGLITFDSPLIDGTVFDAKEVIPGYTVVNGIYTARTNGIPAKNMGDTIYFKAYAKLADGTYVYSEIAGYNAIVYANTVLNSDASNSAKALVVAMLNYGAAAQVQFGYNTDNLMNAGLTAEQQALVDSYSESMVDDVVKADSSKVGLFVNNGGFTNMYPTVSFEGAFSINYYFQTTHTPDTAPTFYYWDADVYANATELTAENATGTITMVLDGDRWVGTLEGIAAKQIDRTYYAAGSYTVGDTTYYSPLVSYSLGNYCESVAAQGNALGAATAVYGYYAEAYFAN